MMHVCMCRGSVSVKRSGRGGPRVSVKNACNKDREDGFKWAHIYVANMEIRSISRSREDNRRGVEWRRGVERTE